MLVFSNTASAAAGAVNLPASRAPLQREPACLQGSREEEKDRTARRAQRLAPDQTSPEDAFARPDSTNLILRSSQSGRLEAWAANSPETALLARDPIALALPFGHVRY